ncbi:MAG: hypothetical protein JWQ38_834 [Flavipsychrobacter sp.]|nr:hypothetical protein [Flavipsychrobacter sp.]
MDLGNATLKKVSVHLVGNKGNGQEFVSSKNTLELNDNDKYILKDSFLSKFSYDLDRYSFHHPSSLDYNEVYNYCLESLAEEKVFHKNSINIAKHLFESSVHPKIKEGELYICLFEGCRVNDAYVEAIGIFKTETKSNFIDLDINTNHTVFTMREGAEVTKFDKAAIVFPTNAENGFDVLIYDNRNKGEEAVFWRETFLGIIPQANEYFQTNQFLSLTKQYIAEQLPQEYEITKTDQIDLLNKSVEYFRANESFDKKEFVKQVFDDSGMGKSFKKFENNYLEDNGLELPDQFDISTQAVKKQARVFKSVLKLDKNFHVYIHGDKSLIEKGYDAKVGKSFYKIYFDEEE